MRAVSSSPRGTDGEWFGYRSYDTFDVDPGEQVVVLQSARTGRVQAIAVGNAVGQMRTGALGGLAADLLARRDANTLGVVGSGSQAWSQVWAITAVRRIDRAMVYSCTAAHAEAFAKRVREELGVNCTAVDSAEAVTRDQAIVVLATNSRTPVLDANWLAPGTHVTTVGPKQQSSDWTWSRPPMSSSPTLCHSFTRTTRRVWSPPRRTQIASRH